MRKAVCSVCLPPETGTLPQPRQRHEIGVRLGGGRHPSKAPGMEIQPEMEQPHLLPSLPFARDFIYSVIKGERAEQPEMLKNGFSEKPGIKRLFFPPPHCKHISVLLLTMPLVPARGQPGREKGCGSRRGDTGVCPALCSRFASQTQGKTGTKRSSGLRQTDAGGCGWGNPLAWLFGEGHSGGRGGHSPPPPTDPRGGWVWGHRGRDVGSDRPLGAASQAGKVLSSPGDFTHQQH